MDREVEVNGDLLFEWVNFDDGDVDSDYVRVIPLEVGLKIEIRDSTLEDLKNTPYIQENFKLKIKRLNRWWYSVYFDEKMVETGIQWE